MKHVVLLAAALMALAVPATAGAQTRSVGIGTARLLTHKIERELEVKQPHWAFVRTGCDRRSRSHVDCGITGTKHDSDGITEQIVYTVHVRGYSRGIWARATFVGPSEVD